ncbi:hypothetical protein GCM10016234_13040 [Tianweitania populi]|uniref:WG repeat-containing protein n=2 Tax=Tianweitania populi TaxID=1607949 RepID=A0A8J3GJ54_9HYPH|nr:hypothetical protein GCM10016234_13040 [Tianweitania populi]
MLTALLMSLLLAQAGDTNVAPLADTYPLPCTYWSERDLETVEHCAAQTADGYSIAPAILADLSYTDDLATITFPGHQWFYRHRNGRLVEVLTYDNGPDAFAEGLARGRIGDDLVYIDHDLDVKISAPYTFGFPFENGRADVCTGCVSKPVGNGEYSYMAGGLWGVIDKQGREIVKLAPLPEQGEKPAKP